MNNKVIINLLAILAFCGCQKKELIDYTYESKVFTATIEDGFTDSTKTTLDSGNVLWKKADQVSIFAGNTKNLQYQVTDASDGKKEAEFKKVSASGFISTSEIDNNVSFYPYSSTVTIEKKSSKYELRGITLPATQTYAADSFGNGAFPMVAVI